MSNDSKDAAKIAVEFLDWKRPGGPWPLTAIATDSGSTPTTWLDSPAAIRAYVEEHSGRVNLYYTVGEVAPGVAKKPTKAQIVETHFLHADIDPPKSLAAVEVDAWIEKTLKRVRSQSTVPPPSLIASSGNGLHLLWRLDMPFPIGGDDNRIADIEGHNRWIASELGADMPTINVDRLLRVYGSVNVPNRKKQALGRVPRDTRLIEKNELAYSLGDFGRVEADRVSGKGKPAKAGIDRDDVTLLNDPAELDQWGVPPWTRAVIVEGNDPTDPDRWGGDRSRAVHAVACQLARCRVPPGLIVGILTDATWGISAHVRDQPRPLEYAWRQVEKAQAAAEADGEPFQTDKDGKPYPNQFNIRLALSKLGVTVRHDIFADRMLVEGLDGCGPHLDDAALDRLWLDIDARFRFRATWEFFVKVVVDTARRTAFHPVRDYLDGLTWDGVHRVESWLTVYGGAVDTAYTRAVGALMLVGAVRRVRQPGVKFDEMLVLESKQGTNKSSALRVLATKDEWFIDDLPLNAESKVVIERLAGRWIAEAAELKGMRKGEVEHLKGFLSRQHDTARMSYARLPVIVPRQCVIFGTTNSQRYLRDLTGNRRFWPVSVEGFDLERLRADVDQLWAEAAEREAAGESIRLDPALWADAEIEQDARRIEDPFASALAAALGDQTGKISCHALWDVLDIPVRMRSQDDNARVGDAMRELGFERKKLRFGGAPEWAYVRGTLEEQSRFIEVDGGLRAEEPGEPY